MARKKRERAWEKVDRSYRGDNSRVLDFVRTSLICETVADAKRALEFVMLRATVFTIKNRLDPAYDGEDTGGYRDINMQLSFEAPTGTPYAGFVLELQIILASFLTIKSDEGHKRYVTCRNLRGD